MAHEGIFATSDEILVRAGVGIGEISGQEARINDLAKHSESEINIALRRNWSDDYADANEDVKRALSSLSAAWCAPHLVAHQMAGYTTRVEAEDIVNIQRDAYLRLLNIMIDQKAEDFMEKEKDQ